MQLQKLCLSKEEETMDFGGNFLERRLSNLNEVKDIPTEELKCSFIAYYPSQTDRSEEVLKGEKPLWEHNGERIVGHYFLSRK